jgi:hypothetical protein
MNININIEGIAGMNYHTDQVEARTVNQGVTFKFGGRFHAIVDESVFYFHVDRFGQPQFDIHLRDRVVEEVRAHIFGMDDDFEALVYIGFGSAEQQAAIEEERRSSLDLDEDDDAEKPLEYDFLDRGNDWLATDAGIVAVLNFDTAHDGFILPLREAWAKSDDLPISQADFLWLAVQRGYADSEGE